MPSTFTNHEMNANMEPKAAKLERFESTCASDLMGCML